MKVILPILISCLLFAGCQKAKFPDTRARLEGNWEWVWSNGGIGGWSLTPASEGYTQRLEFTDKRITKYKNAQIEFEMKYKLKRDTSWLTNNEELIISPGPTQSSYILTFDVDTVYFHQEAADGFTDKYVRIR